MFESYNPLYNILNYLNTTSKFIKYNKTRGRNSIVQDTNITTRSQSTSSYISIASSIDYTTQIEAQNNSWAEQMDIEEGTGISIYIVLSNIQYLNLLSFNFSIQPQAKNTTQIVNNKAVNIFNTSTSSIDNTNTSIEANIIPYYSGAPTDSQLWDRVFTFTSLFGTEKFLVGDTRNIVCSFQCIVIFIKQRNITDKNINNFPQLQEFEFSAQKLLFAIYKSGQDKFSVNTNGLFFRIAIAKQFKKLAKSPQCRNNTKERVSRVPLFILSCPSTIVLAKSKFTITNKPFAQITKLSIENVLKIYKVFLALLSKNIIEMHNAVFKPQTQKYPKISMTTKSPFRKHIIVPITENNRNFILYLADTHINILNRHLQSIKLDIFIDCIYLLQNDIVFTTNKVAKTSNLIIIEKYIKDLEDINEDNTITPHLPQSKSFLKILGIPYYRNNLFNSISSSQIEDIILYTAMFNNITLVLYPQIVKVSPKSNIAIIWVNIWDSQNGIKAKSIINRSFNLKRHITTVRGMNMNPEIPQCRNCWKQGHTTFVYRVHDTKYQKYNSLHKLEYYCELAWYCKTNPKTNPSQLKIRQGKLYPHQFKYINYKDEYQADNANCLFWKHKFNCEQHTKKAQELKKIRAYSIHLSMSGNRQ